MRLLAALLFAVLATACAATPDSADLARTLQPRTVWVVGADGRAVGQATFAEAPAGVLIRLEFLEHGLPAGWHGLHLHVRAT